MSIDKNVCKQCQFEFTKAKYLTKGTVVFSGHCGKSITVRENGIQVFTDDEDCPKCPTFVDPVEYAERILNRIKGE